MAAPGRPHQGLNEVVMTDREQSPSATLGRILSGIGFLWFLFAVLWGLGLIEALGVSGPVASNVGGTIFPAIILIAVGRILRRRGQAGEDSIRPNVSRAPQPLTPPILPGSEPRFDVPTPVSRPTLRPQPRTPTPPKTVVEPVDVAPAGVPSTGPRTQDLDPTPGSPKTSQEMIEEAHRRWGTRP